MRSSRVANRRTWVDFPQPSEPSKLMNGKRDMVSILKQSSGFVEPVQTTPLCYVRRMKNFWLVKQEPESYSWTDFVSDGKTAWTGVRNYTARNNLRKMRTRDEVLFYHSGEEKAVVGIAKVVRTAYSDSTATEGDWSAVDLTPIKSLTRPVSLRDIKSNPRLKEVPLIRQSRLSVMPLSAAEFREILKMAAPK